MSAPASPTLVTLCADVLPVRPLDALSPQNEAVFAALHASDFTLGNFEMPITEQGHPLNKLLNIRAPHSVAPSLPRIGLDAVTLANNHAPDYGWAGLCDTRAALNAQGIRTLGLGENRQAAAAPLFTEVEGLRIGVVAFSCLTPTGCDAADTRPGLSALRVNTAYEVDPWYQMEEPGDPACVRIRTEVRADDLAWAERVVREARAQCDLLIATVHWGFGSTEALADYQPSLARALIEAGADVVHGHHPHAVQAVGFHLGKPIVYSANVLIGQQVYLPASDKVHALWNGMSRDGFVTVLHLQGGVLDRVELRPTVLDAQRLPTFAEGADFERIAQRLQRLSAEHGARAEIADGRVFMQPTSA